LTSIVLLVTPVIFNTEIYIGRGQASELAQISSDASSDAGCLANIQAGVAHAGKSLPHLPVVPPGNR